MSVVEVAEYLVELGLKYWDWYLVIGFFLSIAFTSWDMTRYRIENKGGWLNEFFAFFGLIWIGQVCLFIANALCWPIEIIWRLYKNFIYAC